MGSHMLSNSRPVRNALDVLTVARRRGWTEIHLHLWRRLVIDFFGEVAKNARGGECNPLNIGGTVSACSTTAEQMVLRGGNPFDDPRLQGFSTGLYLFPNDVESRTQKNSWQSLLDYADWIRIGLAGNLKNYTLTQKDGKTVAGRQILYNGTPAMHIPSTRKKTSSMSPPMITRQSSMLVQLKAPARSTLAERIRMNNLALSGPKFSQGCAFLPCWR